MRKQRELLFWALWRFSHLIVKIISNKSSCCCSSGGFHSPKKICYHKIHLLFGIMLQKTVGIVSFLQAERHWWWCCSGESCTLGFDWHLIDIWLTCHHGNRGLTANNMLATRRRWMHVTHRQLHSVSSRSAPADGLFWKSFTSICVTSRHQRLFEKRWSALIKDAGRSTFPLSASCSHIRSFFIWKKTLVLIIKKTKYMWTRTLRAA